MASRAYDFKQLQISLVTILPFSGSLNGKAYNFAQGFKIVPGGYAADSAVLVERMADAWDLKVGADGDGVFSKSNDKSGKVTFALDQTSPSNDDMSLLALADEQFGAGIVGGLGKDLSGNTVFAFTAGRIQKLPNSNFTKKATDRAWVFLIAELDWFLGGVQGPGQNV